MEEGYRPLNRSIIELKDNFNSIVFRRFRSLNRSIIELKVYEPTAETTFFTSLNRSIIELKGASFYSNMDK